MTSQHLVGWLRAPGHRRRRARLLRTLAGVAVVVVSCVVVGAAAPRAVGASEVQWVSTNPVSPGNSSGLSGIDCVASNWCVSVGETNGSDSSQVLAELWNGEQWSTMSVVQSDWTGDPIANTVSCTSPTFCMMVGQVQSQSGANSTFAMQWDGTSWTDTPTIDVSVDDPLVWVSCTSASSCVAEGEAYTCVPDTAGCNSFTEASMFELWNGESWATMPNSQASDSEGLSCASPTFCVQVGYEASEWDGSSWSTMPTPDASITLYSVSCTSPDFCMATGSMATESSQLVPVAEEWDGTQWALVDVGSLAKTSRYYFVSCSSPTFCVSAQDFTTGGVAEWNGSTWTPMPLSSSGPSLGFDLGINCDQSATCFVVGDNDSTDTPFAEEFVAAPPSIVISSPPSGTTYAEGEVVPTAFSCTDGSGPGISSCTDSNGSSSPGALDTSTPGTYEYTVTSTSDDGLSSTDSVSYTVTSAPVATISEPASGQTFSVGEVVPTSFSCTDGSGPGIATCEDSVGATSPGTLDTSTPGTFTYTVDATSNDSQHGSTAITYTVTSAPTAQITSPANGQTFAVGQVVPTSFTCSDGTGPGISSCTDGSDASSPGTLDTESPGTYEYTVTALGDDDQQGSAMITYTVAAAPVAKVYSAPLESEYSQYQDVPIEFGCTDVDGPGITSCLDSNGSSDPGSLDTTTLGEHTYTVTAVSQDGLVSTSSFTYTVAVGPSISIVSPVPGSYVNLATPVNVVFTCSDPDGPGVRSCTDANVGGPSPAPLDAESPGPISVTVDAVSDDGLTDQVTVTYLVVDPPTAYITSPIAEDVTPGQVVPTSFSCYEGVGGPGLESCRDSNGSTSPGDYDTSTTGPHTYTVTATSTDGLTDQVSQNYLVADPPTARISTPSGGTYGLGAHVPTSFSCTEGAGGPGLGECSDSTGHDATSNSWTGEGSLDTSTTGPHTYTVTAGSGDHFSGTASISYTVVAAPTAMIDSPPSGETYRLGETVRTSFSCAESTGGTGLQSCTDSLGASANSPSWSADGVLNTSSVGVHTYTVTALSTDGGSNTATISYTVAAPPTATVSSPSSGGTYALGATIPTSFSCSDSTYGSGLATCADSAGVHATGPSWSAHGDLNTASVGVHTYTVTALSTDGATDATTISYTVVGRPTATITAPSSGRTFVAGQRVPSSFSCADGADGPGIATCRDSNGATSPGLLSTLQPGNFTYSVTATSRDGLTATSTISYRVTCSALTISTLSPLPQGTRGFLLTDSLSVCGGVGPYKWTKSSGTLPAGLALNPATGVISGTPTKAGTFTFTIKVSEQAHPSREVRKTFTLVVQR